ncbi:SDR family NAD(P)-dependent oxidoreductase [Sneathiella chungangensis]|uniref:SDR family NAD(P)-dependent oxidoreductase n=1 Tax=Sneathiella chungangensis TaxID=1418234 RepID=A0A845MGM9_9PROT|nr:SDR family oxidoreductase [Sneathiella chungangensis]MZR22204.1 SDR family NAD(P)-dependent oxidoreductase [Sneathiella chungangensis]
MTKQSCLVVGAGDATGGAIAKRFAREGFETCIVRRARHIDQLNGLAEEIRSAGGSAHAFGADARDEEEIVNLFARIEKDIAPLGVVVFNIGGNVNFPIQEMTSRVYRKVWEMSCFAGFLTGREAAKVMIPRGKGTILFTGATASIRGGAGYSAFAGAKHGLRALAQSLARELGPQGIHVAHVIIDGAIDTQFVKERFPERYKLREQDGLLQPDDIAENYWNLHAQNRTAWTHEMDLRPWMEKMA